MNIQTVEVTDRDYDPTHTQELGHGNTIAAWALVLTVSVGALITGISLFLSAWTGVIIGVVVIAIGCALGIGLKAAGYGVGGKKTVEREAKKDR
ncbi:HGxxPAAW family protein [Micrococcoides hystricis]|uniref:HGxxPAAW family protein n=1 Tax=Micrococcoides hystricis TaxID=1572761 RepID=A0ABV6P6Z5_9MICC